MLDHAGGAGIYHSKAKHIQINEADLVSLDVVEAPELETLDLGHADHERHLVLRHTPALTTVHSGGAGGLIVHLENKSFPAGLVIHGPVTHFDAAWQTEIFNIEIDEFSTKTHWQRLFLLGGYEPDLNDILMQATEHDLVIIHSFESGDEIEGPVPSSFNTSAELVILHLYYADEIMVCGPATFRLFQADEHLEQIYANVEYMQLTNCKQLGNVAPIPTAEPVDIDAFLEGKEDLQEPPMKRMMVRNHYGSSLTIEFYCHRLQLTHSITEKLSYLGADHTLLHSCPRLEDLESDHKGEIETSGRMHYSMFDLASYQLNENVLTDMLAKETDPQAPVYQTIFEQFRYQNTTRGIGVALAVLVKALQLGLPIEQVWQLRMVLANNNMSGKQAGLWRLRGDGAFEAWAHDFYIFHRAAQANLPSALSTIADLVNMVRTRREASQALYNFMKNHYTEACVDVFIRIFKRLQRFSSSLPLLSRSYIDRPTLSFGETAIIFSKRIGDSALTKTVVEMLVNVYDINHNEHLAPLYFQINPTAARMAFLQKAKKEAANDRDPSPFHTPVAPRYYKLAFGHAAASA